MRASACASRSPSAWPSRPLRSPPSRSTTSGRCATSSGAPSTPPTSNPAGEQVLGRRLGLRLRLRLRFRFRLGLRLRLAAAAALRSLARLRPTLLLGPDLGAIEAPLVQRDLDRGRGRDRQDRADDAE